MYMNCANIWGPSDPSVRVQIDTKTLEEEIIGKCPDRDKTRTLERQDRYKRMRQEQNRTRFRIDNVKPWNGF